MTDAAENAKNIKDLHYDLLKILDNSQRIVAKMNDLYQNENPEYVGGGPKNFFGALAVLKTAVAVSAVEWENISFHRGE